MSEDNTTAPPAPADVAKRLSALVPQCDDPSDYTSDEQDILAAAAALTAQAGEIERLKDENHELRIMVMGGEDAPGFALSVSLKDLRDGIIDERHTMMEEVERATRRAEAAEARIAELTEALRTASDLLAERAYGSPARSPGHNARVVMEAALAKGGE